MTEKIYLYTINTFGDVTEHISDKIEEVNDWVGFRHVEELHACFKNRCNCETKHKDGLYHRVIAENPEEILNNSLWLTESNMEKAKGIFRSKIEKEYEKICKKGDKLYQQLEGLNH